MFCNELAFCECRIDEAQLSKKKILGPKLGQICAERTQNQVLVHFLNGNALVFTDFANYGSQLFNIERLAVVKMLKSGGKRIKEDITRCGACGSICVNYEWDIFHHLNSLSFSLSRTLLGIHPHAHTSHIYSHTNIHTHKHTHTQTHTHTHTHTQTYTHTLTHKH